MAAFYADENFRLPVVEARATEGQRALAGKRHPTESEGCAWEAGSLSRRMGGLPDQSAEFAAPASRSARNCTESPERVKRNTC